MTEIFSCPVMFDLHVAFFLLSPLFANSLVHGVLFLVSRVPALV